MSFLCIYFYARFCLKFTRSTILCARSRLNPHTYIASILKLILISPENVNIIHCIENNIQARANKQKKENTLIFDRCSVVLQAQCFKIHCKRKFNVANYKYQILAGFVLKRAI